MKFTHTLSACLLLLSVAVPSTFLFAGVDAKAQLPTSEVDTSGVQLPAPIDPDSIPADDVDPDAERIGASKCEARFTANGRVTTWFDLGDVGGFLSFENKKRECLKRGKNYVPQLNFSTFGFTGQQICDQGGETEVYIDTRVGGKGTSRDGSATSNLQARCDRNCTLIYVP